MLGIELFSPFRYANISAFESSLKNNREQADSNPLTENHLLTNMYFLHNGTSYILKLVYLVAGILQFPRLCSVVSCTSKLTPCLSCYCVSLSVVHVSFCYSESLAWEILFYGFEYVCLKNKIHVMAEGRA